jgi:hypothetical protein
VQHGPSIADIGPVEMGWFPSFLENSDGHLFGQMVQMDTAGMAIPKNIFDQDLGFAQVGLIPVHAAAESIDLKPFFPNLAAFRLHNFPFL